MITEEGGSRKQHLLSALSHVVLRWERKRAETQQISPESPFIHGWTFFTQGGSFSSCSLQNKKTPSSSRFQQKHHNPLTPPLFTQQILLLPFPPFIPAFSIPISQHSHSPQHHNTISTCKQNTQAKNQNHNSIPAIHHHTGSESHSCTKLSRFIFPNRLHPAQNSETKERIKTFASDLGFRTQTCARIEFMFEWLASPAVFSASSDGVAAAVQIVTV